MTGDFDLQRFVEAQEQVYPRALDEIRRGRKRTHWMWFIFPQLTGLGRSAAARLYGLSSVAEAQAYLDHPLLGMRYVESVSALQDLVGQDPVAIFGETDAIKLRSSLTLFEAARGTSLFGAALDRWFGGERDTRTVERLRMPKTETAKI